MGRWCRLPGNSLLMQTCAGAYAALRWAVPTLGSQETHHSPCLLLATPHRKGAQYIVQEASKGINEAQRGEPVVEDSSKMTSWGRHPARILTAAPLARVCLCMQAWKPLQMPWAGQYSRGPRPGLVQAHGSCRWVCSCRARLLVTAGAGDIQSGVRRHIKTVGFPSCAKRVP